MGKAPSNGRARCLHVAGQRGGEGPGRPVARGQVSVAGPGGSGGGCGCCSRGVPELRSGSGEPGLRGAGSGMRWPRLVPPWCGAGGGCGTGGAASLRSVISVRSDRRFVNICDWKCFSKIKA